jgi:hypothetical protein
VSSDRSPRRVLHPHYAGPVGAVVVVVILAIAALFRLRGMSCDNRPPLSTSAWVPTAAVVAVVAMFLLGGLMGGLYRQTRQARPGYGTRLILALLALVFAVAWGYETLSIAPTFPLPFPKGALPITHYIVCVRSYEPDWTLVVFAIAGLLAGRWLWHRPSGV